MPSDDRRERERAARRQLIVTTARALAEAEGWDAVTTRRLSTEIEYSQPVLYKHFSGMEQIAAAVALDGFGELADSLRAANSASGPAADALRRVARAYLDFAGEHPAVYDAMFLRATALGFAADDAAPQLEAAFAALSEAVQAATGGPDVDSLTEVFWAALHGLVILTRTNRLRAGHDAARLDVLVEHFTRD
ncbi:TetR/AcrR family transcriptional regulator [Mycobacterium yunnanensis]|uniref:TetR/AcrR family transcriptional regulator n=1 Tax=Mycobacterium yunnanensis TaxID=368477 RepID=A0A9X2YXH6_9MYCO|nr:TetR/AcrR family transcriptional regulator [Mycobacterium yunnanensis]MCV7420430.1 TetR/AcrR family transcriptional regulator [Mycobacterium yunnanensis]